MPKTETAFTNEQLQAIVDRTDAGFKELAPYMAADEARNLAVQIKGLRAAAGKAMSHQVEALGELLKTPRPAGKPGRPGRVPAEKPVAVKLWDRKAVAKLKSIIAKEFAGSRVDGRTAAAPKVDGRKTLNPRRLVALIKKTLASELKPRRVGKGKKPKDAKLLPKFKRILAKEFKRANLKAAARELKKLARTLGKKPKRQKSVIKWMITETKKGD